VISFSYPYDRSHVLPYQRISILIRGACVETRDARSTGEGSEKGGTSEEMKQKNREFSRNHAMSIHLNLISIGAVIWYGVRLAGRIDVRDSQST
jgi:hypothetical protein